MSIDEQFSKKEGILEVTRCAHSIRPAARILQVSFADEDTENPNMKFLNFILTKV